MTTTFEPWTAYPPLTQDRLSAIATILRDVRRDAVALHEPHSGDGEWSLGCRIYSRSCFTIIRASANYDWLTILPEREALRFSFGVGDIPLRFYRGNADDPPIKYAQTTFGEQLLLAFNGVSSTEFVLRLAIETDAARLASKVILVEMDEGTGNVTNTYEIPFDVQSSNVVPLQALAVSLPAVELPTTAEAEAEAAAEAEAQSANDDSRNSDASSQ